MTDVGTISASLARLGLAGSGKHPVLTPLDGGVSSEIYRAELDNGPVCVKRALPRLRVAAVWEAPIERNAAEADWLRVAARVVPEAAPEVLAEDRAAGLFVMPFLDPARYPVWKAQLLAGRINVATAEQVGVRLAAIHAATAGDASIAQNFANDGTFHAIRLEPYLLATAEKHPDLRGALEGLAAVTAETRRALVHGDVSPKNILVGPQGPVFIDAECAVYGDPAFDLGFCLNHLLLKGVWRPQDVARYCKCFDALVASYLAGVGWEPAAELERRTARLLPGLMLARIDGKSPVEYITAASDKDLVRAFAIERLREPRDRLSDIAETWPGSVAP